MGVGNRLRGNIKAVVEIDHMNRLLDGSGIVMIVVGEGVIIMGEDVGMRVTTTAIRGKGDSDTDSNHELPEFLC